MGSILGDSLRILLHSGLGLGGKILGDMITTPMKTAAEAKLLGTKALIGAGGVAPEEGMAPWRSEVERLTKVKWPTYQGPTGNVLGETGEKLAMTPREGAPVTPELKERVLRPAAGLTDLLGSHLQQHPEMIPDMVGVKTGLKASAGQLLQDTQKAAAQEIQRTRDESNALIQQSRLANQEQSLQNTFALGQERMARMGDQLQFQRDKLAQTQGTAQEKMEAEQADKLMGRIQPLMKESTNPNLPMKDRVIAADKVNELITLGKELHPKHFEKATPIPFSAKQTWGEWWNDQPGSQRTIDPNAAVAPSGGAPAAAAPSTTPQGKPKTGTVNSGPNKGKRISVYPDGTTIYE